MTLVDRVQKLLVAPSAEWAVIKDEPQAVAQLFTRYVMILAAIPAVASFIGWSVVGYGGLGTTYRIPIAAGVATMVLSYGLTLAGVYALALVIDAMAPNFGGEKDFMRALKVSAFFPTAYWLAGFFYVLPALSILAILGGLYSLWLLYTGLGPLMEVGEEKAVGYTAAVVLVAVVITLAIALVGALAMPSATRGF